MTEIICAVVSALAAVVCAFIARSSKAAASRAERHASLRERHGELMLQMLDATLQLSVVTANAMTGGHNNGNVERARLAADEAAKEYNAFAKKVANHEVAK